MSITDSELSRFKPLAKKAALVCIAIAVLSTAGFRFIETVPPGHVKIGTFFGEPDNYTIAEGFHFVNPLKVYHSYDCRQKSVFFQDISLTSQDQLTSKADVSIQWRLDRSKVPQIVKEVGNIEDMWKIHLKPKSRSVLREQSKTVKSAEEFHVSEEQSRLQSSIHDMLSAYCTPHGLLIEDVQIRDIRLPDTLQKAIEAKKTSEQEALRQEAVLAKFVIEQRKKVETSKANAEAADEDAKAIRTLADARAYEIRETNTALQGNPGYIKLQSVKAMVSISENPASTVYFINGDSPDPLPLINMGGPMNGDNAGAAAHKVATHGRGVSSENDDS